MVMFATHQTTVDLIPACLLRNLTLFVFLSPVYLSCLLTESFLHVQISPINQQKETLIIFPFLFTPPSYCLTYFLKSRPILTLFIPSLPTAWSIPVWHWTTLFLQNLHVQVTSDLHAKSNRFFILFALS
jgi:hypothetical protein